MKLSFAEKQQLTKPISLLANWVNPNNAKQANSFQFSLSVEKEVDADGTLYTLSFWQSLETSYTTDIPTKMQIRGNNDEVINASAKTKLTGITNTKIGEFRISVAGNSFNVASKWEALAENQFRNGSAIVVVESLTYNRSTFKDIVVNTPQDIFFTLLDLNEKAIFQNPTISLLLQLIAENNTDAPEENSYKDVFVNWFEAQFTKEERKAYGNSFLAQYEALKA